MDAGLYKLGYFPALSPGDDPGYEPGTDEAFRHDGTFAVDAGDGWSRLRVGVPRAGVELLLNLAGILEGPFKLLYIVFARPIGIESGRYESAGWLSLGEITETLNAYAEMLERDGRHAIWVMSETGQVIYDQHEMLFFYGPVATAQELIETLGFIPGDPRVPSPHVHHYHDVYDSQSEAFVRSREWLWSELREGDDP
ncbi:MAG: hypothetical protein AAGB51_07265 [Planctomycetota bacterium]